MRQRNDIAEASAEMLLNYLYPEVGRKWVARGEGNFYDGWMKDPMSAMISCNDGFRPFSFYIEVID